MEKKEILDYAKQHYSSLVVDVEYIGLWNGFEVWDPLFSETPETLYIGLPITVLVKGDQIRLTEDPKEVFQAYYDAKMPDTEL